MVAPEPPFASRCETNSDNGGSVLAAQRSRTPTKRAHCSMRAGQVGTGNSAGARRSCTNTTSRSAHSSSISSTRKRSAPCGTAQHRTWCREIQSATRKKFRRRSRSSWTGFPREPGRHRAVWFAVFRPRCPTLLKPGGVRSRGKGSGLCRVSALAFRENPAVVLLRDVNDLLVQVSHFVHGAVAATHPLPGVRIVLVCGRVVVH